MLYVVLIALIVVAEQSIKNHMDRKIAHGEQKYILGRRIILKKLYNKGMFLNFMENKVDLVKKISLLTLGAVLLIFAMLLPKKDNRLLKFALALSLGGAISNVYDRLQRGHVVDYFSFNTKKLKSIVFNIADICIFVGSILMLLIGLFSKSGCSNEALK